MLEGGVPRSLDVSFHVPTDDERADQPLEGMVAVNKMVMEVDLRFPLPLAVFSLLNAWNLAPLQQTPNSWVQIICTFTLFGGHRLYCHPSPLEMNYLFKLTKQKDMIGGYHIQGRHGKAVLGVLNKFRGDPSKWFWVGGAWKSAAIDNPTMEIDIPGAKSEFPRSVS
ncbi:hypothetical protein OROHE_014517 [Orobanche hederae]